MCFRYLCLWHGLVEQVQNYVQADMAQRVVYHVPSCEAQVGAFKDFTPDAAPATAAEPEAKEDAPADEEAPAESEDAGGAGGGGDYPPHTVMGLPALSPTMSQGAQPAHGAYACPSLCPSACPYVCSFCGYTQWALQCIDARSSVSPWCRLTHESDSLSILQRQLVTSLTTWQLKHKL